MPSSGVPRIAYFPDSFHEVNGVAHTSRNFAAYAQRRGIPMLCVRAGAATGRLPRQGSLRALELGRSPLAVRVEKDLSFDPLFFRYTNRISAVVRSFRPDVIHITGPSELGLFGAYFAHRLRIPLAASWHTNLHEYAGRRMRWLSRHLGSAGRHLEQGVEGLALSTVAAFYRRAQVLYAPNPGLCRLLEDVTQRPCHLMQRGVDTELFRPAPHPRMPLDAEVVLGYVGRLSVEKNVTLLPKVDLQLRNLGLRPRWLIVGHGAEQGYLQRHLAHAELTGVLHGEALARAYAAMDLLVFPSHTDTFGNVVLEALSSGVPAVVTPDGGPAHILRSAMHGGCGGSEGAILPGCIARDEAFAPAIAQALTQPTLLGRMRAAAREYALRCSWDAVFDQVIRAYPHAASARPSTEQLL